MDLAITAIKMVSPIKSTTLKLGEAVPAFSVVYNVAGSYFLADCLDTTKAAAAYFTVLGGDTGDYVLAFPVDGYSIELVGPTLVQGTQYVLSAVGGKIAPKADLTTGQFITELFLAVDATTARWSLDKSGIAVG